MRLVGRGSQTAATVGFVVGIVAGEPHHLRASLEGQDVSSDPVEKPAVVTHDDDAAREIEERVLQGPEGVDIQVVCRLVKEQHIGGAR